MVTGWPAQRAPDGGRDGGRIDPEQQGRGDGRAGRGNARGVAASVIFAIFRHVVSGFHPAIERWFESRFREPTEPQPARVATHPGAAGTR